MREPLIVESARRHNVRDEDQLHAWRHFGYAEEIDGDMLMLVGPDRAGNLLEIGTVEARDPDFDEAIVHAMSARQYWAAKYQEATR